MSHVPTHSHCFLSYHQASILRVPLPFLCVIPSHHMGKPSNEYSFARKPVTALDLTTLKSQSFLSDQLKNHAPHMITALL